MQRHRNDKCGDDCPFARRFVHRGGRRNALSMWPACCWRSRYPHHPSVPRYVWSLQCC